MYTCNWYHNQSANMWFLKLYCYFKNKQWNQILGSICTVYECRYTYNTVVYKLYINKMSPYSNSHYLSFYCQYSLTTVVFNWQVYQLLSKLLLNYCCVEMKLLSNYGTVWWRFIRKYSYFHVLLSKQTNLHAVILKLHLCLFWEQNVCIIWRTAK